jgi:hypothetical protein
LSSHLFACISYCIEMCPISAYSTSLLVDLLFALGMKNGQLFSMGAATLQIKTDFVVTPN